MSETASRSSGGTAGVLPRERAACSFDVGALRLAMTGRREAKASGFEGLFEGAPFDSTEEDAFRGYLDLYRVKHQRAAAAMRLVHEHEDFRLAHQRGRVQMGRFLESCGFGIHFSMFLTFLRTQASEEQQAAWLGKALSGRFLGAYAQTELGHGSNIRALETTATFDRAADEFVVHSPTLTSMKWWPTGIYACTHGVVMAQLIIDGVNYGFHGFFLQLRDDEGRCMPGVEVGEIGPKFDPQHNYIGYARFDHVRIPRFHMFAKNQQVTREGVYVAAPPKLSKFKYISMMSTRVAFVNMSGHSLGQAATIAIRYACVRRQGFKDTQAPDPLASGEHVVMDYKVQQYRALKALALAYMFILNGRWLNEYLGRVQRAVSEGDESAADELPELHASCAGLKVWATLYAHEGMEDMRRSCGGQGFLRSSGLGDIVTSFGVAVTGEGEQVILSMQAARFVIKAVREVRAGRPPVSTAAYLLGDGARPDVRLLAGQPEALVELMGDRARPPMTDAVAAVPGASKFKPAPKLGAADGPLKLVPPKAAVAAPRLVLPGGPAGRAPAAVPAPTPTPRPVKPPAPKHVPPKHVPPPIRSPTPAPAGSADASQPPEQAPQKAAPRRPKPPSYPPPGFEVRSKAGIPTSPGQRVIVSGFPPDLEALPRGDLAEHVRAQLEAFGPLSLAPLVTQAPGGGSLKATAAFESLESAQLAVEALHGTIFDVALGTARQPAAGTAGRPAPPAGAGAAPPGLRLHLDELEMPLRPEVAPASTDREVWAELPGGALEARLAAFGELEEVRPVPRGAPARGYARFREHAAAEACVRAGAAAWSESERVLASRASGARGAAVRAYPDDVAALLGDGGELTALREKCGLRRLALQGPGLPEASESGRLCFLADGDDAALAGVRAELEMRLAAIHGDVRMHLEQLGLNWMDDREAEWRELQSRRAAQAPRAAAGGRGRGSAPEPAKVGAGPGGGAGGEPPSKRRRPTAGGPPAQKVS